MDNRTFLSLGNPIAWSTDTSTSEMDWTHYSAGKFMRSRKKKRKPKNQRNTAQQPFPNSALRLGEFQEQQHRGLQPLIRELELKPRGHQTLMRELESLSHPLQRRLEPPQRAVEQPQREERMEQLQRGLESQRRGLESQRRGLEPLQRRLEPLQRGLEQPQRGLEQLQRVLESQQRGLEPLQRGQEPLQRGFEPLRRRAEPFQREYEPWQRGLEPPQRGLELLQRGLQPQQRALPREVELKQRGLEPVPRGLDQRHGGLDQRHNETSDPRCLQERLQGNNPPRKRPLTGSFDLGPKKQARKVTKKKNIGIQPRPSAEQNGSSVGTMAKIFPWERESCEGRMQNSDSHEGSFQSGEQWSQEFLPRPGCERRMSPANMQMRRDWPHAEGQAQSRDSRNSVDFEDTYNSFEIPARKWHQEYFPTPNDRSRFNDRDSLAPVHLDVKRERSSFDGRDFPDSTEFNDTFETPYERRVITEKWNHKNFSRPNEGRTKNFVSSTKFAVKNQGLRIFNKKTSPATGKGKLTRCMQVSTPCQIGHAACQIGPPLSDADPDLVKDAIALPGERVLQASAQRFVPLAEGKFPAWPSTSFLRSGKKGQTLVTMIGRPRNINATSGMSGPITSTPVVQRSLNKFINQNSQPVVDNKKRDATWEKQLFKFRKQQRVLQKQVEASEIQQGAVLQDEPSFCQICQLLYRESEEHHVLSELHIKIRHILQPVCHDCQLQFKTRPAYTRHLSSLQHKKCIESKKQAGVPAGHLVSLPDKNVKAFIDIKNENGSVHQPNEGRNGALKVEANSTDERDTKTHVENLLKDWPSCNDSNTFKTLERDMKGVADKEDECDLSYMLHMGDFEVVDAVGENSDEDNDNQTLGEDTCYQTVDQDISEEKEDICYQTIHQDISEEKEDTCYQTIDQDISEVKDAGGVVHCIENQSKPLFSFNLDASGTETDTSSSQIIGDEQNQPDSVQPEVVVIE